MPTRDEALTHRALQQLPGEVDELRKELREANDHLTALTEEVAKIAFAVEGLPNADMVSAWIERLTDAVRVHG